MSNQKSKTKKIIISVIIIALIAIAIIIFTVSRKNKNKDKNSDNILPVGQSMTIDAQINSDVINQKVCPEYNGNYIFYGIANISYTKSLSRYEEMKAYQSITGLNIKDKNSFLYYLGKQKKYDITGEIITLIQGKYTKSINQTKSESGLFFGNLNKSIIFLKDPNGTTIVDEINYSQSFDISETGYWLDKKTIDHYTQIEKDEDIELIYIREKLYYGENLKDYLYVTYTYKMI